MPLWDPYQGARHEPLQASPPKGADRIPWPLVDDLFAWSSSNNADHQRMLEAVSNRFQKPDEAIFLLQCAGGLFRRRAAADLPWLWQTLEEQRPVVLQLCEYITPGDKRICGLWPPGGPSKGAWREWLNVLEQVSEMEWWANPMLADSVEPHEIIQAVAPSGPEELNDLFSGGRV